MGRTLARIAAIVVCVILIGCGTSGTFQSGGDGAAAPPAATSTGTTTGGGAQTPLTASTGQALFIPAASKTVPKASDPDIVTRGRVVTVNQPLLGALDGTLRKAAGAKVAQPVTLNLFDDTQVVASLDRAIDGYEGNRAWIGKVVGDPLSLVIFVQREDAFVGSIVYRGQSYRVRCLGDGFSAIEKLDVSLEPPCGGMPDSEAGAAPKADSPAPDANKQAAATSTVIDLLIVYTAKAVAEQGGTNGLLATLNLGVLETNYSLAYSQISNVQINLVSAQQVAYSEVLGNLSSDLDWVSRSSSVNTLQQNTGADLAMLVTSGNMDPAQGATITTGGVARLKTALGKQVSTQEPYGRGFCVVPISQIQAWNSFPHELGHTFGMVHDQANSPGQGFYSDSYGWRVSGQYRDIMSYPCSVNCSGCTDCTMVWCYANPNVTTQDGWVTGTAQAYAARTIMNTASDIAAYTNPAPTPSPVTNPASTSPRVVVGLGASGKGTSEVWYPGASSFSLTRLATPQLAWPGYNATSNASVFTASGDIDGDGLDELVVGLGPNGQGWSCVLDDADHGYALLGWFQLDWAAYNRSANAPTYPGCFDLTGTGKMVIAIGTGPGGQGWVEFFEWNRAQGKIVPKVVGPSAWLQVDWAGYNASPYAEVHPAGAYFAGNGRNNVNRQPGSLLLGLGRPGKGWVQRLDSNGVTLNTSTWFQTGWSGYNSWAEASTWPAAGDYDGDGYDDLAVGYGYNGYGWISVMRNDGTGKLGSESWQRVSLSGYSGPDNIGYTFPTWGDVDLDGKDDLIVGLGPAGLGHIDILKGNTWTHTLVRSQVASYGDATRPACLRPSTSPTPTPSPSPSPSPSPTGSPNLVVNGDFSQGGQSWTFSDDSYTEPQGAPASAQVAYANNTAIITATNKTGTGSLKQTFSSIHVTRVSFDYEVTDPSGWMTVTLFSSGTSNCPYGWSKIEIFERFQGNPYWMVNLANGECNMTNVSIAALPQDGRKGNFELLVGTNSCTLKRNGTTLGTSNFNDSRTAEGITTIQLRGMTTSSSQIKFTNVVVNGN